MDTENERAHQMIRHLAAYQIGSRADIDLPDAVEGFLLDLEIENRTPKTLDFYRGNLSRFLWFCEQNAFPRKLREFNSGHIKAFLGYIQTNPRRWADADHPTGNRPAKAITVVRYRASLHALWGWAIREEIVEANPVSKVRPPKVEKRVIPSLSALEKRKLLEACRHNRRDRAMILLLLDTGIRVSELYNLKLSEWDRSRRLLINGKGRKQRYVGMSPTTAKCVWDYVEKERPADSPFEEIFLSEHGTPLTKWGVALMLKRRAKDAGIRHIHPHMLRHTCALDLCEAGAPLNAVQEMLGHESSDMTLWYARMASQRSADVLRSFSPVQRLGMRFRDNPRPIDKKPKKK